MRMAGSEASRRGRSTGDPVVIAARAAATSLPGSRSPQRRSRHSRRAGGRSGEGGVRRGRRHRSNRRGPGRRDRRGRRRGVDGVGRWRSGSGTGRRERRRPGCRRRTCRSGHPSSYVPTRLRCAAGERPPARSFREGSFPREGRRGRLRRRSRAGWSPRQPGRRTGLPRTRPDPPRPPAPDTSRTSDRSASPPHHTIPPSVHRDSIMRDSDDAKPPGSQAAACRRPSRTQKTPAQRVCAAYSRAIYRAQGPTSVLKGQLSRSVTLAPL